MDLLLPGGWGVKYRQISGVADLICCSRGREWDQAVVGVTSGFGIELKEKVHVQVYFCYAGLCYS